MRVREVIGRMEVKTCGPNASVLDAASVMASSNIGAIVVVDDKRETVGILTERDLLVRVVAAGRIPAKTEVRDVMTSPVSTADAAITIWQAHHMMVERGFRHLPIVEDRKLVGIISERAVSKILEKRLESGQYQRADSSGAY